MKFKKTLLMLLGVSLIVSASLKKVESEKEEYKLELNIPEYTLRLFKDRELIEKYEVTVGKPATKTPLGKYKIIEKKNWGGIYSGVWMPFIKTKWGGWGIHGFYSDYSMGHALSKGCVRIYKGARELKETIPVGTPLDIIYNTIYIKGDTLVIASDIYEQGTNTFDNVIKKLQNMDYALAEIDITKINEVLKEAEVNTAIYISTVGRLYGEYIKPLPEGINKNLLKKNPQMKDFLKVMMEHREEKILLEDLLKENKNIEIKK